MAKHGAARDERSGKKGEHATGATSGDGAARGRLKPVSGSRSSPGDASSSPAAGAPELDRLIHERMRLGIVSALAVNESLTFNDLKRLMNTTDGNLSVHARKLEDAAYLSCTKSFEGRVPKTEYRLTAAGRPRQSPAERPPPVAVHDDRDVQTLRRTERTLIHKVSSRKKSDAWRQAPAYRSRVALINASMWSRYRSSARRPGPVSRYSVFGTRPSNDLVQAM